MGKLAVSSQLRCTAKNFVDPPLLGYRPWPLHDEVRVGAFGISLFLFKYDKISPKNQEMEE